MTEVAGSHWLQEEASGIVIKVYVRSESYGLQHTVINKIIFLSL